MQLVFFFSLGACSHSVGDSSRWYRVPPALPASWLTAPHKPPRAGGGEVADQGGLLHGPGWTSPGLEAAAMRSELTVAPSQFCTKQNKKVFLVTKGPGPLKQLKTQEWQSRPIREWWFALQEDPLLHKRSSPRGCNRWSSGAGKGGKWVKIQFTKQWFSHNSSIACSVV